MPPIQNTPLPSHQIIRAPGVTFIITNHLFGRPLYSWWVFEVAEYDAHDITGVLMDDIRGSIHGPYAERTDANEAVKGFQGDILAGLDTLV